MGAPTSIAVKVCGVTNPIQATEIAQTGVNAIGVIGVSSSKRFVIEKVRREIFSAVKKNNPQVQRVWVIANLEDSSICKSLQGEGTPSVIQLHGDETPKECKRLREKFPKVEWWKALKIKSQKDLALAETYSKNVDAVLLDAWDPIQLGGTGKRLPLEWLKQNQIPLPWWLAGGISAEFIPELLAEVRPSGIDASSRLESSTGKKDLGKVKDLLAAVRGLEKDLTF
ncbi:phosphoribosylanthranilate isomerase [Prochlorococcus sp. MIT 1341]|uniref:phosphoribosylanthranilate isomerase n=1 Tax=Prochlorococcus sp. MIT 1341 TaxID=3096221 RepID=UPI002A7553F3|nr:phosphoribosylanthranilate isomerase [Prochlorococcus sp. MIT 1341]